MSEIIGILMVVILSVVTPQIIVCLLALTRMANQITKTLKGESPFNTTNNVYFHSEKQ